MSDRVRLDWFVPSEEWQLFRDFVQDEYGCIDGYLGREAEDAMQAYADEDGYADVERRVDELVRAAGRTPSGVFKEKKNSLAEAETTRVTARVDERVRNKFRAVAKQGDDRLGVAFARAIRTHRNGGRPKRLERKLDRVLEDATDLLAEMNPSTDSGMSAKQKKVVTICKNLPEQFTDDDLIAEIDAVAGRGDTASEPTRETYKADVLGRLDVEPHPNTPDLWIPQELAEQYTPEGSPRVCRVPAEHLDRGERARRIRLAVGLRASKRENGCVRVDSSTIREDVLDDAVTQSTTLELLEEASRTSGFEVDSSRSESSLCVNLKVVGDSAPELFEDIVAYRDGGASGLLSGPTGTRVDDFTKPSVPEDVTEEMDSLVSAVPDGGEETEEDDQDT